MVETTNATTDNTNKDLDYGEVYEYIRGHESFKERVYLDTKRIPTVRQFLIRHGL
ncbi:MAG: hypothetical protein BWY78_00608 [Alphaproteobacteria bacterium ADurb.Bin438]|nr:MAG: hypothetical protein BWY78_00608 [Alphaproteobacteria bacterium ADurb.Bin438]